jgi:hypothetical protein
MRPETLRWSSVRKHAVQLLSDDRAQAVTEYILIIGLISAPIWVVFKLVFEKFLSDFITNIINSFTKG